ncbi:MAG: hypothetical protein KA004_16275 [Verrucomicrobiales bacterium]|nr:hypothetical protein [Verrucomicrobiales bacterium]
MALRFPLPVLLTHGSLAVGLLLAACSPGDAPRRGPLRVEVRADGLAYPAGSKEPYTGKFIAMNRNGTIHSEQTYERGVRHGWRQTYFEDGQRKHRSDYVRGEIVRDREWYRNGQLKSDEAMKNGISFGLSTYWFMDGRIRKIANVGEGFALHGQVLEFAENGEVLVDALYQNGTAVSGKGVQIAPAKPPASVPASPGSKPLVAEALPSPPDSTASP